MTTVRVTHIGGPTCLIEAAGWRLLTDPTFDEPGRRYPFGWGTSSRKLSGPAVGAADLGPVDAVLLSHDHHGDNLDDAGRALLPSIPTVVTTGAGRRRLGSAVAGAIGLAPWESTVLRAGGRPPVEVTATPCRHGPPLSRPLAGEVVGFALRWDGQEHGALWITGDTVLYRAVRRVPEQLGVGTAIVHLGGVRFPITGPLRYSMTARDAVALCREGPIRTAIPVHYEGWEHFREGRDGIERELAGVPEDVRRRFAWARLGTPVEVVT